MDISKTQYTWPDDYQTFKHKERLGTLAFQQQYGVSYQEALVAVVEVSISLPFLAFLRQMITDIIDWHLNRLFLTESFWRRDLRNSQKHA